MAKGVDITPLGKTDAGAERETREREGKPCLKRVDCADLHGQPAIAWCFLPDGHGGDCRSVQPRALKRSDFSPRRSK